MPPAGVRFSFSWEPSPEDIVFGLEHWANGVVDMTEPFTAIERLFRKHEQRLFNTEGAYGPSGPWADLSPGYAEWKEWNFPGMPILVQRGRLRAALVDGKGEGAITNITGSFMEVGVDGDVVEYAAAHQQGIGVPERRPVDIEPDVRKRGGFAWAAAQVLQAYVVWMRKRAFAQSGRIDRDPFELDERAESSIIAAMELHTGNVDATDALTDASLSALGLG